VYLDGRLVGTLDRRFAAPDGSLPPVQIKGPARLDILVANDGRVNVDHTMRTETKGITQFVAIEGRPLSDWKVYLLPMNSLPTAYSKLAPVAQEPPTYFRSHFTLTETGDTFLDTRNLGKGVVFINGHNLGRFWSVGPQQTLYVPGPWLHKGANEIVVFDLLPQAHESVEGLDHPILDGPVSDKTTSNQE
jgi:beta-galactosidase